MMMLRYKNSVLFAPSAVLVLIVLILVSGCADRVSLPDGEIRVGLLFPMTGESAGFGNDCVNGSLLAIEEINAEGGIRSMNGAMLVPVTGDTRGNISEGIAQTIRLIEAENVSAIIGAYHSSIVIAATEVAEKQKTPFIVSVGVADPVTERGFRYLFRLIPRAENYGKDQVRFLMYLSNQTGIPFRRVALLHENTGFGTSVALGQRDALIRAGFEPVIEVGYDAETVSGMSDEISRIISANPDVILETTYIRDSILIRNELDRAGYDSLLIDSAGGTVTPRYRDELGSSADGTLTLSEYSTRTREGGELNERFLSRFGTNITGDSAYSYQAVRVLQDALERAGTGDRELLREALARTDMKKSDRMILPGEGILFDETGQNMYSQLYMLQAQDGELVLVWPESDMTSPVILPSTIQS